MKMASTLVLNVSPKTCAVTSYENRRSLVCFKSRSRHTSLTYDRHECSDSNLTMIGYGHSHTSSRVPAMHRNMASFSTDLSEPMCSKNAAYLAPR